MLRKPNSSFPSFHADEMTVASKVMLEVRVQPSASRNACVIDESGRIRIALTAPPVEGAANSALVAFLAKQLGIAKRDVEVVRGQTSRQKIVAVYGLTQDIIHARLTA